LDRLRRRGKFEMPQSSLDAIRQLEELASPISAFVRDRCIVNANEREDVKTLFRAWQDWCDMHGYKAGPAQVFGRNLLAALPQVRVRGRAPSRFYEGVGLKT
jgi:putative DNA primase/helicase